MTPGDRIAELEAFVAVARLGSFARAAAALSLSTSAVSRRVAALEARLGRTLLYRSTRRVTLSDDGERCVAPATRLVDDWQALAGEPGSGALQGRLRLTMPAAFSRQWAAAALPRWLRQHPDLALDVSFTDQVVDLVATGTDLALRFGTLPDSGLVARRLGRLRRVLVAAPAYLQRAGTPRNPQDLVGHALLVYALLGSGDRWTLDRRGEQASVPLQGRLRSDSKDAIHAAARQGLGIAMLAQFDVQADLADGRLQQVLPAWRAPEAGIYAVHPAGRHPPARVRAAIEFLAETLPPLLREPA